MYNIGSCCFELKNLEEAIGFFDQSLCIDEAHVKSLTKRAHSLFQCGHFEDCIIDCTELNSIYPSAENTQLRQKAIKAKAMRGEPNIYKILEVRDNCDPVEMAAAFKIFIEKYDPEIYQPVNKLKRHQQSWKYKFLKTKFDHFKSIQNLAMDESA